jgi:hypothetical protein
MPIERVPAPVVAPTFWLEGEVLGLHDGAVLITAESVALAVADPPPEMVAVFTSGEPALAATVNVAVIAG